MIVYWMVIIIGIDPGIHFGIIGQHDSIEECRAEIRKAPEHLKPKLACLPVAPRTTFDL